MVEIENLDKFIKKVNNIANMDLSEALDECGYVVENQAKINVQHGGITDTGQLAQSIEHKLIDTHSVEIGTNNEYAMYVHEGTGIFAQGGNGRTSPWSYYYRGNKLASYEEPDDNGGVWRTTYGQRPKPFLTDALHSHERHIKEIIENAVKEQILNDNH